MSLLVRNGRIVDPGSGTDAVLDLLLEEGRIARIAPRLEAPGTPAIDASGLVVAPGFIDLHVHFREPGQEAKETIATGAAAASRGGFTLVCAMPNTNPVNDSPEVTRFIAGRAAEGPVRVLPIAALTRGLEGREPTDMAALRAAGAAAFSDDGACIQEAGIMRRVLEAARELGVLVSDHPEDRFLSRGGVMHEGDVSRRLGLPGIPAAAEEVMIARDIALAEELGVRIHLAHLSTAEGARMVRAARGRGVRVTAEVTPHHLVLTDEALGARDAVFKVNPPLRSRADAEALAEAAADGTIAAFVTDHAPHTAADKALGMERAPFGLIGLETAVSVLLDRLVRTGRLSLARFVEMWSLGPATILGLAGKGRLSPGAVADLTLLDLDRETVVEPASFASKARNCPFAGWRLRGAAAMTIVAGRIVHPQPS